ncbi:MAG TPA: hypothetical protein VH597_03875 [Verrucomicrobiae bacterium]|jgi:hypothetical protein|nr:hypothetical protein [Verrucomicrobiae bacterium]
MQNTALTEQESSWVNEVAHRLRLIQADADSLGPEKRREYLQEEIARSLKNVPPARRKGHLEWLLERFPVAGRIVTSAAPIAAPAPAPKPVAETPGQILDRFLAAAPGLPEDHRKAFSKKLADAGFASVDRDAQTMDVSEELRQKLGLKPEQEPRLARVIQLTVLLTDIFDRLDQTAVATLRDLAPKSPLLKRQHSFRGVATRFLVAENEGEQMEAQLRAVASLLGALLAATLGGGKEFGKRFVERFTPEAIEDVITGEGGKMFGPNKKERCWDRYKDLAGDYATPDLIDRRIKEAFAAIVERTMTSGR